jgi:hypothetical protein
MARVLFESVLIYMCQTGLLQFGAKEHSFMLISVSGFLSVYNYTNVSTVILY